MCRNIATCNPVSYYIKKLVSQLKRADKNVFASVSQTAMQHYLCYYFNKSSVCNQHQDTQ